MGNPELREAIAHHQAGRLAEAEALYRRILARAPDHPDALHMLGLLAHRAGQLDAAAALIGRAIAVAPGHAPAHGNLGNLLLDQGRVDDAIASFRRALALDPQFAEAHNNLGNALRVAGDPAQAAAAFARAITLRPEFAEAHNNLGLVLLDTGRVEEAIASFRRALALREAFAEAHNNLGLALEAGGQPEAALVNLRRALELRPDYAEAHNNLGNALKALGRFDEAEAAYRNALSLRPHYPEAHNNLGLTLQDQGRVQEALAAYRRAGAARPDFAEAHWNEALAHLLMGDFAAGWRLYEWRWRALGTRRLVRDYSQPAWLGEEPLAGRTLLVHYEQGLGDTLQMLRYVPLLQARGARVIVEVPPALAALARTLPGAARIVPEGEPLPPFELQCPLMSLPLAFRTELGTVPANVPYLSAAEAAAEAWRARLGPAARRRIGLAWSGSTAHRNDRQRSVGLQRLLPLLEVDAEFISLQREYREGDAGLLAADGRIRDFSTDLTDFAATAALVGQLDLVISVDTAVAHLAGAMGKPVWLLLPYAPDYRWLLGRTDSPWYPTMRLFRQPVFGDWDSVVGCLVAGLRP